MKGCLFIGFVCLTLFCACALQQDVVILDDRLTRVERRDAELEQKLSQIQSQLETYSQTAGEEDQSLRKQAAGLRVMINNLREEIQVLYGGVEEARHLLNQNLKDLKDSEKQRENRFKLLEENKGSTENRIARIEEYLNLEPSLKSETVKKSDLQPAKELSEDEIYNQAKQALDKGDLETAREGFKTFLKRYPQSTRADNAQFWIGEIYYREKWYEKAILEYQKVIEKYPQGNKVPAALLKQGLAFFNLGDKVNSRLILKELVTKYPKSNEGKIAKQKIKGL
jgi:tol-pal system protein YbgF